MRRAKKIINEKTIPCPLTCVVCIHMESQILELDFDEMTDRVRNEIKKYQNFNFVTLPDEKNKDGAMAFFKKKFKRISTFY